MDIIEREGLQRNHRRRTIIPRCELGGQIHHGRRSAWTRPDDRHRAVNDKPRETGNRIRNRVADLAFERGLMVLGCGETTIRISPPLTVKQEEATVAMDILELPRIASPKGAP